MNKETLKKIWNEWILTLGIAFLVAFFIRTTLFSPRHIPTGSMIPTIKIGEFIFVNMFAYDWHYPFTRSSMKVRYDPERGDIVVFEYPLDPDKDYIKRVIAIPGDTVEVREKRVYVNGEPYAVAIQEDKALIKDLVPKYNPDLMTLAKENTSGVEHSIVYMNDREDPTATNMEPVVVPPQSFFVMGDNRDDSQDSRFWGFVPREKLLGKAGFIWFSFDIHHPPWIRFGRIGTILR